MAIQSVTIDPGATAMTGDDIIDAINSGTAQITRDDSIDCDALDIIKTKRVAGHYVIKYMHRKDDGKINIDYDDEAIT